MASAALPALFVSHGAPTLAIDDSPAGRFLDALAQPWPRPQAIVIASAHYGTCMPAVGAAERPGTIHDFGGFPAALHALRYPAPGAPALAGRIAALLKARGLQPRLDPAQGLDHGVWVPLRRLYPAADVPVVPLSVVPRGDARLHLAIGSALAPLRAEGVLVIGSGGLVHNLRALDPGAAEGSAAPWAQEFADWIRRRLHEDDLDALLDWAARAPHAARAHPTPEHLFPLFVALGAAGPPWSARSLHRSFAYGSLALETIALGASTHDDA